MVAIAPPTIRSALAAYAAPRGVVVGAISADRAISLTGTFGSDWVQIHTLDSGAVWVKKVDLPSAVLDPVALARLPDLAPPPTATALPSRSHPLRVRSRLPRPRAAPAAPVRSTASNCTSDRVVAIAQRRTASGKLFVAQDAQIRLNGGTVVAANADEAQAFYARVAAQVTAFVQP